jgi:hypothetical protein
MGGFRRVAGWSRLGRRGLLAAAVVVALAAAGAAFAWEGEGFSSTSLVTATFYANTVSNSQSQTCTAANNDSIQVTDATYTGTAASSDAHLNGPITLEVRSVYDATTNAGTVFADVQIGNPATPPASFEGRLIAVNASGHLQGLLTGHENGGGGLLANVTATFSAGGGFNSSSSQGMIGSGPGTNTAIVTGAGCTQSGGDEDQNDNDQDEHSGGDNHGGIASFNHSHSDDHDSQH